MQVVRTIKDMRGARIGMGKRVGFVPTMGCLHDGHLSLVRAAKRDCEKVVASIFVNPAQFGPTEDLDRYPRPFERDMELLRKEGVDILFAPDKGDIYPAGYRTYVELEGIDQQTREGGARPGFFRGVATVVSKLFNVVQPSHAYFGQKDGIQCLVIRKMVTDLNFPVNVVICPTQREDDGLAMSSRNTYLTPADRSLAPIVHAALMAAKEACETQRVLEAGKLVGIAKEVLQTKSGVRMDYITVSSMDTGSETAEVPPQGAMLSAAVWINKTRLIDNVILLPK